MTHPPEADRPTPSIKGTAFDSVVRDVRGLIEARRLSRAKVERTLQREHVRFLDEKIAPANWYPIECYARLLEALCEVEASGRSEDYLFRRGAVAVERLRAAGIYPQLDASTERLGLRVAPLVISIASAIYNFMHWRVEIDARRDTFHVTIDGAADYPDIARYAAAGFIHGTAEQMSGREAKVSSERPTPDRVLFHVALGNPRTAN